MGFFIFSFMLIIVVIWITFGFFRYFEIREQFKVFEEKIIELEESERNVKDMSKSISFYLPKVKLEQEYEELTKIFQNKKYHTFKYQITFLAKCIILGPISYY